MLSNTEFSDQFLIFHFLFFRQLLLCRVTLGKSFLQFSAIKMAHSPPGHHSIIGRPSSGGLMFPEYVVYRGEQVIFRQFLVETHVLPVYFFRWPNNIMKSKFKQWSSIFHLHQQNEQQPVTSHWTKKKRPWHMSMEIQVLAWDWHKNMVGLNQLMGSQKYLC